MVFNMNLKKITSSVIKNKKLLIDDIRKIGVYFLIRNNIIVYVGQSFHVYQRLTLHVIEKLKNFDSFFFLECREDEIDDLESYFIVKYSPEYNSAKNKQHDQLRRAKKMGWNGIVESCEL